MDKKKKAERPRLRKEDISTPVNFVHVQHVGFNGSKHHHHHHNNALSGSFSACTSPTAQALQFFDPNHRLSDSSLCGQSQPLTSVPSGKENRFSQPFAFQNPPVRPSIKPPQPPIHGSMSNLSHLGQRESFESANLNSKQLKNSFSGSLLNLSFLQFGKSSSASRHEGSKSSKRMSLGPQAHNMGSSMLFTVPCSPPPELPKSPPPPLTSTNSKPNFVRRRSSSFAGQADFQFTPQLPQSESSGQSQAKETKGGGMLGGLVRTNSSLSAWIKKPKIARNPSQASPPLSPTYDELPPPPPCDTDFSFSTCPDPLSLPLPESPFFELLPPPPSPGVERRHKANSALSSPGIIQSQNQNQSKTSGTLKSLSASPPPPIRKQSLPEYQTPGHPNPTIPVINGASKTGNNVGLKLPTWRAKVVRVNAPTLPPLSVPLLNPSNGTLPSPPTWPFEPGMTDLNHEYEEPNQNRGSLPLPPCEIIPEQEYDLPEPPPSPPPPSIPMLFDGDRMEASLRMQSMRSKIKKVEQEHIYPLSRLFQSRTSFNQWPTVVNELFSTMTSPAPDEGDSKGKSGTSKSRDPTVSKIYGELVTKTLELWLELGAGNGTFEDVISAFERAQNTFTKLPSSEGAKGK